MLRDRLEEGVHLRGTRYENDHQASRFVGTLDAINQIENLDYDGLVNFLEGESYGK